jgi:hypothetical protein
MFAPHSKTTDTTFLFKHHLEAVIDLCLDKFFTVVQVRVFTGTMDTFPRIYALPGSGSTGLCGSSSAACLGGTILTLSAAAAAAASAATASAAAATAAAATTAAAVTVTRNIHTSTVTVAAVSAASVGRPHLMRSATLAAAAAALTFPRPRARSGL